MIRVKRWVTGLLLGSALSAQAAPGRVVSPYSPQVAARPLANTALMTLAVTNKKKTYNRGFLDAMQYQQIKYGAMEIVKRFPPNKWFYVTLGRSPTAIAAFFDNLSEKEGDLHVNLPASNLRAGVTEGFEAQWYAHLDRFLPAHVLEGKQKIVLIDRSTTGATLLKVKGIIESYLTNKGIKKTVEVVAFARAERAVPIEFIDVTQHPELLHMNSGTYDNVAKYPWFYVGQSDPATLNALPAYDTFKGTLLERMRRDVQLGSEISAFTSAEVPAKGL